MLITLIRNGQKERHLVDSEFSGQIDRQEKIRKKAKYYAGRYDMTTKEAYELAKTIVN